MKDINESVALGIVAVHELQELIDTERNDEKKAVLISVRYTYYYLIKNLVDQFGVTRLNVIEALKNNGYDYETSIMITDKYEEYACHIVKIDEPKDYT